MICRKDGRLQRPPYTLYTLESLGFEILTVIIYNSLTHFSRNVTRVLAVVMITLDGVANTSLFVFLLSSKYQSVTFGCNTSLAIYLGFYISIYISFFLNNNNSTALVDKCTEYTTSNTHTAGLVFVAHTVLIAIAMLTFW